MPNMTEKEVASLIDKTINQLNAPLYGDKAVKLILTTKGQLAAGGTYGERELTLGLNYLLKQGDTITERFDNEMKKLSSKEKAVTKIIQDEQDKLSLKPPLPLNQMIDEIKKHQEKFNDILNALDGFANYCEAQQDFTVFHYQFFVKGLKNDFSEAGNAFFSSFESRNEKELNQSFINFKTTLEHLSHKAERKFKHNTGLWHNYIKPILKGFLGVVVGVALSLFSFGLVPYAVFKEPVVWSIYVGSFFKPESQSVKNAKVQWNNYAIKETLFGNKQSETKGIIKEIDQTLENNKSVKYDK